VSSFDIDIDMASVAESLDDLKDKWETDAVFTVGSNVEYGVYLEFGTRDMPPYPWFRPAILEFEANPQDFVIENTNFNSIQEIPNGDTLVRAVSNALENKMTDNVNAQKAVDRSPGTNPEHPRRQDGNLTASIQAVRLK